MTAVHPATRWSVAAIDVALVVVATRRPFAWTADGQLVHVSRSTVLALGVIVIGISLVRSPASTRTIQYAVGWTVAGALALAAAGAYARHAPVTPDIARSVVKFDLAAGPPPTPEASSARGTPTATTCRPPRHHR